jgi:hypothetical protein
MTHTTQVGRNVSAALALLAISAWFGTARADGVALNRYGASETVEDGFCVSRPDDRGNAKLDTVLHLEYANDPLVLELEQGDADSEAASVVSDQLSAHLSLSLGMWNQVVFFAGLSGNLLMSGEQYVDPVSLTTVNTADGPGLGDVRLGARARLLGRSKDLVGLGVQLTATLPVGDAAASDQHYSGDEAATLFPEVLAELRPGGVRITGNLGSRIRRDTDLGTVAAQDELTFGLGLTLPVIEGSLDLLAESYGSTSFKEFAG